MTHKIDRIIKDYKSRPIIQQIRATGELGDKFTTQELQAMDESSLLASLNRLEVKKQLAIMVL